MIVMKYNSLNKIRVHESARTLKRWTSREIWRETNRERGTQIERELQRGGKELPNSGMMMNNYRINDGIRKSLFCKHCSINSFRQESFMDIKTHV